MKNIAVFVSGGGSDLQSVIDGCESGDICGRICAVISSKSGVYALERAKKYNIPSYVFDKKDYKSLEDMFGQVIKLLKGIGTDLIVLAGYLSILTPNMINEYSGRIINIHPSLIPAFCGKGFYGLKVHKAVLDCGCKVTGATVHFVDEGADTGAIILQEAVKVESGDTPETLQKRVLETEHRLLPLAVKLYCGGKIKLSGKTAVITE